MKCAGLALRGGGARLTFPMRQSVQRRSKARLPWGPTKHVDNIYLSSTSRFFFLFCTFLSKSHVFIAEKKNVDSMRNSKDVERKVRQPLPQREGLLALCRVSVSL